jgi:hypothetical protein
MRPGDHSFERHASTIDSVIFARDGNRRGTEYGERGKLLSHAGPFFQHHSRKAVLWCRRRAAGGRSKSQRIAMREHGSSARRKAHAQTCRAQAICAPLP